MNRLLNGFANTLALCGMVMLSAMPHALCEELVLCIGQDGHLEIEIAESGKCIDPPNFETHSQTLLTTINPALAENCGNCHDIRLAHGEVQARQQLAPSAKLKINAITTIGPVESKRRTALAFFTHPEPSPFPVYPTDQLRTVRLII